MKQAHDIVVFGLGWLGKEAVRRLKENGCPPVAILDEFASATAFEGVPIKRAADFSARDRAATLLLVAVDNPHGPLNNLPLHAEKRKEACQPADPQWQTGTIIARLKNEGWPQVESFIAYHWQNLRPWYWMGPKDVHNGREAEIEQARSLWADGASRQLYDACVVAHRDQSLEKMPAASPLKRLLPADKFGAFLGGWSVPELYAYFCDDEVGRWPEPLRYIDCGAYNGAGLAAADAAGYALEAYIGLEPDPVNFAAVAAKAKVVPGAQALPLAVSDRTEQLRFCLDGEKGRLGNGEAVVQAVAIDDAFYSFRPSLITMDVEGAEKNILQGARATIRACRPGLAIRVYHLPDDFYALPLLVQDITQGLGYRLYLRRFVNSLVDMTLYAVPA